MKKYELLKDDSIKVHGRILYRIRALISFNNVKRGELGGYIEKEENLSHKGNCWVCDKYAMVFGNAKVRGNAMVRNSAWVFGCAEVGDYAEVRDNAWVFGSAKIHDRVIINGSMWVVD